MKKQAIYSASVSVLIPLCYTSIVNADNHQLDSKPEIAVVASRIEQPLEQIGSTVVVLYAEELQARGIEYVSDALLEVPSLNVSSYGPRGSFAQVRLRGNESNHVLVLIDGVRMSSASTGEFDFSTLSMASVDRIEILMGPQSTLYGSDAAAGVISITTKKGQEGVQGQVHAAVGSQNTRSGFVNLLGANDGWNYAITVESSHTDGVSAGKERHNNQSLEDDGSRADSMNAKLGYDHQVFQTWVNYSKSDARYEFDDDSYTTGKATDNPNNKQLTETEALAWVLAVPLMDGRFKNQFQIADVNNDYDSYAFDLANSLGKSTYITQTDRKTIEYQGSYQLTKEQTLQFGAEQIKEKLMTDYQSTFSQSYFNDKVKQKGLYLQWLSTFGQLDLSLGGRSDDHDEFGRHNTYRFTANYRVDEQWRVFGSYGTGFKAPSLLDLYNPELGGNLALKPEKTKSKEISVEYQNDSYLARLTVFDQDTTHLIRWIPNPATPWTGTLENADEADSFGIETTFGTMWDDFELEVGLTWLDATETKNDNTTDRLRMPEWSGNAILSYHYSKGRVWTQLQYRGERDDQNFATNTPVTLSDYWLMNVGVNYQLTKDITLTARIDNIADEDYEEVYSYATRGRTATAAIDWRF